MSETSWDVAIVGGGPGGCSSAITLARHGLRVVLFESKTYPHDKLCGEFLSPECAGLLKELGMNRRLKELNPIHIRSASLTTVDGTAWETRLPGTALGISRKALDSALAEQARHAGVTVREAETVTGIAGNLHEGFELDVAGRSHSATVYTRSVIAAHGKRGTLDRALNRRFLHQRQPFVAFKAHFHGPPIPGRIELHTFPGGYCGMSEIEGGNKVVCLLVQEQVFREVAGRGNGPERVERFVNWMKAQNIYLHSWLQWAERIHDHWITIAQVPFMRKPVMERDVLMAGDAAGLIVPLAGNGIAMALEGGILAAGYLARYLEGETTVQFLRSAYSRAWQRSFATRIRLGQILQPFILRPQAASLALRFMNAFPMVGRFLVEHTRGPSYPGLEEPDC